MRLRRCFSAAPLATGSVVTLTGSAAAHMAKVLRLRPGDELTVFDGRGGEYDARLLPQSHAQSPMRGQLRVEVGEHHAIEREPPLRLVLLQCLARGERMDWIMQKATELGVAVIVPIASRHSVVQLDQAGRERRLAHWRAIVIGACEQCGRNRPPEILPVSDLAAACEAEALPPALCRLCLAPEAEASLATLLQPLTSRRGVALLVGPEGGLSADEQVQLRQRGFTPCRLGPRILRAETAPIAALAAILALAGDLA